MSSHSVLTWKGIEITARAMEAAHRGLFMAAEHVLEEANRTVPLREGTLQHSGHTALDTAEHRSAVYYDSVYAHRQHEELNWHHSPGRRAKWLELTLQEQGAVAQQIIGAEIKKVLG